MIRRVDNKKDADICDTLLNKLILDEERYDKKINKNFIVKDYFSNVIKNQDNILLIEEENNRIVGYVFAKKINDDDVSSYIGYLIDGLFVQEEYRHQGLGKRLLIEIIKMCESNGASYIDINVMYKNEDAKKLYKELGFNDFKVSLRKELH